VIEVAAASGLDLLAEAERDGEAASSVGTGELVVAGARGWSAAGVGGGGRQCDERRWSGRDRGDRGCRRAGGAALKVLCDVRTPFELAAARFAPQKGADEAAVARLARRLELNGRRVLRRDPRGVPMSGAAGRPLGRSSGRQFDAVLVPGAPFVLDALDFDRRLRASHAVVLGEGRLDATTLDGKALAEAATRARTARRSAHAIVAINALDAFDARILDLQTITEARTIDQLTSAAEQLAAQL